MRKIIKIDPLKGVCERDAPLLFVTFFISALCSVLIMAFCNPSGMQGASTAVIGFFSIAACFCAAFAAKPCPAECLSVAADEDDTFAIRKRVLIYERERRIKEAKLRLNFAAMGCGLVGLCAGLALYCF